MKLGVSFVALAAACVLSCSAVRSALDWGEAECAIVDQTPQPVEVTVVCDFIDTIGTVVDVVSMKAPPEEASAIVARHPVKLGHPDPRALKVTR